MSIVSAWPALVSLFLALGCTALLSRWLPEPSASGRFAAVDGLRGYLALMVFLHHAVIWHGYTASGQWGRPASGLYLLFGRGSVLVFFMITAHLFIGKLLAARQGPPLDWLRLYVSRFTRLVPMYAVAMVLLVLGVAVLSGWQLRQAPLPLAKAAIHWLTFNLRGYDDLNGVVDTHLVLAGVTWTLACEWMFYGALPLLALALGVRGSPGWGLVGLLVLAAGWEANHQPAYGLAFACGGLTAALVRHARARRVLAHPVAAVVGAQALLLAVQLPPPPGHLGSVLLLALFFAPVAAGQGYLGLFTHRWSRQLGELTYSLYLLHGFALWLVLWPRMGHPDTVAGHWGTVWLLTPALVAVSVLGYRLVELPAMQRTDALTAWLRRRGRRQRTAAVEAGAPAP
jgi:peptidoglycan/LPS O-acetylase OafA/YrhL